jgi:hypothetical protein
MDKSCETCKDLALWNDKRPCELNENLMRECLANNYLKWKPGKPPMKNPEDVLGNYINPLDYKVDEEARVIYVKGLHQLGQKLKKQWSPMAVSAEWEGWNLVDVMEGK